MVDEEESVRSVAARVRRMTNNRDVLRLCDHVLAPAVAVPEKVEVGIPATGCPECARRNTYQRELMRKRRAKA